MWPYDDPCLPSPGGLVGTGYAERCLAGPFHGVQFPFRTSRGIARIWQHLTGVGAPAPTLEELFKCSQVLVDLAALTPANHGIVDERLLRMLPVDAVFVNIGRGAVVDEQALIRIAREGKLQIALDVFENEPLAADSPFRDHPNILSLPHLGGPTTDRISDAGALAVANVCRFLKSEPLVSEITSEIFKRIT